MKHEMILNVPDGFRVIEKECTVGLNKLNALIPLLKKCNITSITHDGDTAKLVWHSIECPCCRRLKPSYKKHFGKIPAETQEAISKWSEPQYSLFEDCKSTFTINNVRTPKDFYRCPYCGHESTPFREEIPFLIITKKDKVIFSCESYNPKGLLSVSKYSEVKADMIQFPVFEFLEFNLRNGHSSICFEDRDRNTILIMDLTFSGSISWCNTTSYKLINSNDYIKRKLRSALELIYPCGIPFSAEEISPENAVAMTWFHGFNRIFYDAIPYDVCDGTIDSGFIKFIKKIRNEKDIPRLLLESSLPDVKSLKRIIFSSPGLAFYIPEMEKLYHIYDEINYFTRLLESSHSFIILSFLRQFPKTLEFFDEYKRIKDASSLYLIMTTRWKEVSEYSLRFSSMSSVARKKECKGWMHTKSALCTRQAPYIPMPASPKTIEDCVINGYSFKWLKTRNDYLRAGEALDNCLTEWSPLGNPVTIVTRNSRAIAAIEVCGKEIIQARAEGNSSICLDDELFSAFIAWKDKYSLRDVPEFFEINDDELDF